MKATMYAQVLRRCFSINLCRRAHKRKVNIYMKYQSFSLTCISKQTKYVIENDVDGRLNFSEPTDQVELDNNHQFKVIFNSVAY
jgi:hypothetical protein